MELPWRTARFFGSSNRSMVILSVATLFSFLVLNLTPVRAAIQNTRDLFHSTNLLHLAIQIPEDGIQALRESRGGRNPQAKTKAQATVADGGHVYTNVTVQLKGFTTFQPIDGLPSLTLNFGKLAPKQRFHGLAKISLNNSLQDATRLHEKFAREMFAAAGVPVPRADYAVVTLNGRELGLYVLVEGYDKLFLKRHFKRTDGNLYEGGVLRDIDQPLRLNSGKSSSDHADVTRLIQAAEEPDPEKRWRALEAALDMDRFLSMMAIETMLCHSDSYSMNRNNYRLYHDPGTDKMIFMPHGMDRILGTHRSPLDLPAVPPAMGLIARAVLSTPEGRRRYVERAGMLFTNLFQPNRLCRRVREIDAKIVGVKTSQPADGRFDQYPNRDGAHDADVLCDRITERAAQLKLQFGHVPDLLALALNPQFDADGVALLDGWKQKPRLGRPEALCETSAIDGKQIVHLQSANGPLNAVLHTQVSLPSGRYRLIGPISVTDSRGGTNFVATTMVRYSNARFDIVRQRQISKVIYFSFQVSHALTPEEIEFICEIRSNASEVWFDANSLQLIQEHR